MKLISRLPIVVLGCLFMLACVSEEAIREKYGLGDTSNTVARLDALDGHPIDEYIEENGPPTREYPLSNGNKLLQFHKERIINGPGDGAPLQFHCDTNLTVNSDGKIVNWAFKGNDCGSSSPKEVPNAMPTTPNNDPRISGAENIEFARSNLEQEKREWEKKVKMYQDIDKFGKDNPAWWRHLLDEWEKVSHSDPAIAEAKKFKAELASWERQKKEWEKKFQIYMDIDEYATRHSEWWQSVNGSWSQSQKGVTRNGPASTSNH